jgi:IclR family pca regulon transcriptional regulator
MGRVLLAGLPDDLLAPLLARIELRPLTARTITDRDALEALLARVRKQGYALTDQELEQGLRSIAVPIRDGSGAVAAALNVSVHASRATATALKRDVLPLLLETAAAIETDVRRAGP